MRPQYDHHDLHDHHDLENTRAHVEEKKVKKSSFFRNRVLNRYESRVTVDGVIPKTSAKGITDKFNSFQIKTSNPKCDGSRSPYCASKSQQEDLSCSSLSFSTFSVNDTSICTRPTEQDDDRNAPAHSRLHDVYNENYSSGTSKAANLEVQTNRKSDETATESRNEESYGSMNISECTQKRKNWFAKKNSSNEKNHSSQTSKASQSSKAQERACARSPTFFVSPKINPKFSKKSEHRCRDPSPLKRHVSSAEHYRRDPAPLKRNTSSAEQSWHDLSPLKRNNSSAEQSWHDLSPLKRNTSLARNKYEKVKETENTYIQTDPEKLGSFDHSVSNFQSHENQYAMQSIEHKTSKDKEASPSDSIDVDPESSPQKNCKNKEKTLESLSMDSNNYTPFQTESFSSKFRSASFSSKIQRKDTIETWELKSIDTTLYDNDIGESEQNHHQVLDSGCENLQSAVKKMLNAFVETADENENMFFNSPNMKNDFYSIIQTYAGNLSLNKGDSDLERTLHQLALVLNKKKKDDYDNATTEMLVIQLVSKVTEMVKRKKKKKLSTIEICRLHSDINNCLRKKYFTSQNLDNRDETITNIKREKEVTSDESQLTALEHTLNYVTNQASKLLLSVNECGVGEREAIEYGSKMNSSGKKHSKKAKRLSAKDKKNPYDIENNKKSKKKESIDKDEYVGTKKNRSKNKQSRIARQVPDIENDDKLMKNEFIDKEHLVFEIIYSFFDFCDYTELDDVINKEKMQETIYKKKKRSKKK